MTKENILDCQNRSELVECLQLDFEVDDFAAAIHGLKQEELDHIKKIDPALHQYLDNLKNNLEGLNAIFKSEGY